MPVVQQEEIDAAVQNGTRHVTLGPCRHETEGIVITSGPFVLRGMGTNTRLVCTNPSRPAIRIAGSQPKGARYVTVENLEIGRDNPTEKNIGILADNVYALTLDKLSIWQQHTGVWIGREGDHDIECQAVRLTDSVIRGIVPSPDNTGTGIRLGGGVADVIIDRIFVEGGQRSIVIEYNANGIYVTNCNLQTADKFGIVSIGSGFARHILHSIIGGSFHNQAIYAEMSGGQHAFRLRIANCWLESGEDVGILATVKDGLAIHDNRVGQFGSCGIRVVNSDRIAVVGNCLEGNIRTGSPTIDQGSLEIEDCDSGFVSNNLVKSPNGKSLIWYKGNNTGLVQTPNIELR